MPILNRSQLADLRGVTRMVFDATEAVAEVVEKMHRTIQLRPGPLSVAATGRAGGGSGLAYRSIRGGIRLVGRTIDVGLASMTILLSEGDSSPALDAYRSAANGVYGDYLLRTGNPLAIDMSLRSRGRRVDPHDPSSTFDQHSDVTPMNKLVVLVHGLCMNDRQWCRDGHDHGAALADDLRILPLYLRYNSGLHIASNGRAFAEMLETLVDHWSVPLDELVIVGHSMDPSRHAIFRIFRNGAELSAEPADSEVSMSRGRQR